MNNFGISQYNENFFQSNRVIHNPHIGRPTPSSNPLPLLHGTLDPRRHKPVARIIANDNDVRT